MIKKIVDFLRPTQATTCIKDDSEISRLYHVYRLRMIIGITAGYAFYYTCRLGLAVTRGPLIESGIATPTQIGQIGGAIFYGYAFGKLINGFIADHVNIRKLFVGGLLLSVICNFVFGFSSSIWAFTIAWGLNGWFQGFGPGCCCVAIANWWEKKERGRYFGIWGASHCIGEGMTYLFTSAIVAWLGWRVGFIAPGILCALASIAIYWLYQDRPASRGLPPIAEWKPEQDHVELHNASGNSNEMALVSVGRENSSTLKEAHTVNVRTVIDDVTKEATPISVNLESSLSIKDRIARQISIFKSIPIWILCASSAAMYITRYAIANWGILYLQEAKGFSVVNAGSLMGINTAAGVLGGIAYGYFSDKVCNGRRPPATLIWGIIQIIGLWGIFLSPFTSYKFIFGSFIVYGFGIGGLLTVICGLFVAELASKHASGAATGFVGIFSYLAAAMQENISGVLIERNMKIVEGVRHYDFTKPIIFWISSAVVSLVLVSTLWNVKTND